MQWLWGHPLGGGGAAYPVVSPIVKYFRVESLGRWQYFLRTGDGTCRRVPQQCPRVPQGWAAGQVTVPLEDRAGDLQKYPTAASHIPTGSLDRWQYLQRTEQRTCKSSPQGRLLDCINISAVSRDRFVPLAPRSPEGQQAPRRPLMIHQCRMVSDLPSGARSPDPRVWRRVHARTQIRNAWHEEMHMHGHTRRVRGLGKVRNVKERSNCLWISVWLWVNIRACILTHAMTRIYVSVYVSITQYRILHWRIFGWFSTAAQKLQQLTADLWAVDCSFSDKLHSSLYLKLGNVRRRLFSSKPG